MFIAGQVVLFLSGYRIQRQQGFIEIAWEGIVWNHLPEYCQEEGIMLDHRVQFTGRAVAPPGGGIVPYQSIEKLLVEILASGLDIVHQVTDEVNIRTADAGKEIIRRI